MTRVTLLGAGGNMGQRITRALLADDRFDLCYVEPSEAGRSRLADLGLSATEQAEALAGCNTVIFAVPDMIVRHVAEEVVPALEPGTSILFLDPAAVVAERIPRRDDIHCYVTHPTHPPLYGLLAEQDASARRDFWGGGLAHQAIVFAIAWGDEGAQADLVEALASSMFAPVTRSHRITPEQMAMLEPALSETLINGCLALMREGMELVIKAGVPEEATRDFLMGHLQIGISIIFDELDWKLSKGAEMALSKAKESLFKDDWYRIFEPDAIIASVEEITGGRDAPALDGTRSA